MESCGNLDAIELGSSALPSIDPFDDIGPLLSTQLEDSCYNVGVIDEYIDIDNNVVDKDDENDYERFQHQKRNHIIKSCKK